MKCDFSYVRVSLHDFLHATKSACRCFAVFTNLASFPLWCHLQSAIVLHIHLRPCLRVLCLHFYFLENKKNIIFSSISCFYYLYRRLMFLISFFACFLLASKRMPFFANRSSVRERFVCLCVSVYSCGFHCLWPIKQFASISRLMMASQNNKYRLYNTVCNFQNAFETEGKAFLIQTGRRFRFFCFFSLRCFNYC